MLFLTFLPRMSRMKTSLKWKSMMRESIRARATKVPRCLNAVNFETLGSISSSQVSAISTHLGMPPVGQSSLIGAGNNPLG